MKLDRHTHINNDSLDRSNTFVEVHNPAWRDPNKISVEELVGKTQKYDISKHIDKHTIIIDEKTLKIKVNEEVLDHPSVFSEKFIDQNINYNLPPVNASMISGMHMGTNIYLSKDSNFLYVWVGDRWKRAILSEWE